LAKQKGDLPVQKLQNFKTQLFTIACLITGELTLPSTRLNQWKQVLWSNIEITPTDQAFFSCFWQFLQSKWKRNCKKKSKTSQVFFVETMTKFATKRTLQATLKNNVNVS
jgi:hypothetical protein